MIENGNPMMGGGCCSMTEEQLEKYRVATELFVTGAIGVESLRAQGAESQLNTDINSQIGRINTKIAEAESATSAAISATTATISATTAANEATEATNAAIEQAERVNVELSGSVVTVTDKYGNESEIDLLDATNERVYINITTDVAGVSVEGLTINAYYNNAEQPSATATTDAQGKCYLDVPNNYRYRLVFPTITGCDPITDVTHIAHASQRIVDVEYKETVTPTIGEKVLIILQERKLQDYSRLANKIVTITFDGHSTDYTTDDNGMIKDVIIPFNTQYTVTFPTVEGYYIMGGIYTSNYLADKSSRSLIMNYYPFDSGVFIVDDENNRYNLQQWMDLEIPNDKAVAIMIATTSLYDNGGVFGIGIDYTVERNYARAGVKTIFMSANRLLTNIPADGSTPTSEYYYDGNTAMMIAKMEMMDNGYTSEAINAVESNSITVGGIVITGFLGSVGQFVVLKGLISQIDNILDVVRPNSTYRLRDYMGWPKWTMAQAGTNQQYTYINTISSRNKDVPQQTSWATYCNAFPFFKF